MSRKSYLDMDGLLYFWNKVKEYANSVVLNVEVVTYDASASAFVATDKNGTKREILKLSALKSNMSLNNVDNTSDANKPVSTAVQTELDKKAAKSTTLAGYGIANAYTKSEVDDKVSAVNGRIDTLVGPGTTKAIDTLEEIKSFLNGIEDTNLQALLDGITQNIGDAGYVQEADLLAITSAEIDAITNTSQSSGGSDGGDKGDQDHTGA